MKTHRTITRAFTWLLMSIVLIPATLFAVEYGEPGEEIFSHEELTQMLAPIALYPDSLVAQILIASTYPLEIVEADRFMGNSRGLKGEPLNNALLDKDWDPSVKFLCSFPDLLAAMSDKLDQTRELGDAFLAQEDDVMSVIQELRRRAEDQGNFDSTSQQKVIVEEEIIRIEPQDPEVVYVPVYDPLYVYGPWWYPAYLPYYWYFPPVYAGIGSHIGFGYHISFGFGLFSWGWFDWHSHRIHVDYDRIRHFDRRPFDRRHFVGDRNRAFWRHDPGHRRGVSYRDRRTSDHFGSRPWMEPRRHDRRGFQSGVVERRIRGERRFAPQPDQGRRITSPETPQVTSPVRGDTPDRRWRGDGRFERRDMERRGEGRRTLDIGTPRRVIIQPGTETTPNSGSSRTFERRGRSGRVEAGPRRTRSGSQRGGEFINRGRENRSPATVITPGGTPAAPPRPEFRQQERSGTRSQGAFSPQISTRPAERPVWSGGGGSSRHGEGSGRDWGRRSGRGEDSGGGGRRH